MNLPNIVFLVAPGYRAISYYAPELVFNIQQRLNITKKEQALLTLCCGAVNSSQDVIWLHFFSDLFFFLFVFLSRSKIKKDLL